MANEKRLTKKHYDGTGYYMKCSEECHLVDLSCEDCVKMGNLVDRLGEYEDKAEQSVDAVEVVNGRWEIANDGTHFCPHCGCDAPYTWDDIDRNFINSADDVPDRPSNYCPNCGAKMDGDGNG